MTGLNLESFLHLLRADLGAWVTLGTIAVVLALMAWTSWGSRRALRKCLVLSVIAHFGLALYGGTVPVIFLAIHPDEDVQTERIRQIKVVPATEPSDEGNPVSGPNGPPGNTRLSRWDRPVGGLALADTKLSLPRDSTSSELPVQPGKRVDLKTASADPAETSPPALSSPELRPPEPATAEINPDPAKPGGADDVAPAIVASNPEPAPATPPASLSDRRLRPERPRPAATPEPIEPRRVVEQATELPAVNPPLTGPLAPPESIDPRREGSTPAQGDPVPTAAAAIGAKDIAAAEIIPARPDSPRISAGDVNLRTRSRPGNGTGGVGPLPPVRRPPLAMALRAPAIAGPSESSPAAPTERPGGQALGPLEGDGRGTVASLPAATDGDDRATADVVKTPVAPLPRVALPDVDVRRRSRPSTATAAASDLDRRRAATAPLALARVTPTGVPALPEIRGSAGGRPLSDVPEVYRSRLDPNRSARAFRAGASPASEQAVERALDWLARHQDADGRWDGATAHYDDGTVVTGDDDFTIHCPPGETCFGECVYWEADTALTGLALLSYLGAGYTHTDGKYAETVSKGLDFLLGAQKPDGDLRGASKAVGMYCHAMATVAMCEAYAMTGDERLRASVERAVAFLVRSRANDGLAWRYAPGAPVGDTSILGWVVMALKSAREVGLTLPANVQAGTLTWLSKVASGDSNGLACYQPGDGVTPTMTAEAWVCRQFLGAGGPGPASSEAASYLLAHGPNAETYNLYYWYYGTLAMYQHGGDAWYRWNALVRDEITRRQVVQGHAAGSWAPDPSPYGVKGGRIYCTALATLSLEVYYRYLRLYDDPKIPPAVAPRPRRGDRDPALGRLGSPASDPARNTPSNRPKR